MDKASRSSAAKMGLGLLACIALTPTIANAAAVDLYYERTVIAVAGARCGLFTPNLASALAASQAQARGAALRAGIEAAELSRIEARATAKARAEPCSSPDLNLIADRARTAFQGYARLSKMSYPGDHLGWTAEKIASKSGRVWSLSQPVPFGRDLLTFGLAGQNGAHELMAVAKFNDGAEPYAARLVLRDVARTQRPYLDHRRKDAKGVLPLAGRVSPRSATKAYLADAKMKPDLLITPPKVTGAVAYRFPAAAAAALANLDPREAVEIEFLFAGSSGQDVIRRAYIEVGDFAAGRAFLTVAAK